jgi:ubiquinone/menaquinone biosynthesis C-methylase UbiE
MSSWNEIWDIKAEAAIDSSNHDIINGFAHCDNKIDSKKIFEHLLEKNNIKKHESILEFGCGSGRIGQYFINNDYNYTGLDRSENMVNTFKNLLNVKNIYQINDLSLPFESNSFDVIICYSVIQYLSNLDEFTFLLNEMIRVSKRIIYIGDIESIDHTNNNNQYHAYKSDLKHLIINKEYIKNLDLKYEINIDSLFCTRNSRYNCIIKII